MCIRNGCYEYAVKDGRCGQHALGHGWDSSTRVRPVGWDRTRKRILRRDKHRCRICGKHGRLVDHLRAQAFGGSEHHDNLRCVCSGCHRSKTLDEQRLGKQIKGKPREVRERAIVELVARWS